MSHYDVTKARIYQWIGIILIMAVFSGAYWYFKVYGSTLNQSQNDLNTNGLVGLWSFNGDDISGTTAYDRSGSGNNGTLTNGPTVADGKVGQALNFNGSTQYVTAGDVAVVDTATALTVCAWVKHNTITSDDAIVAKEDVVGSDGVILFRDDVGAVSGRTDIYSFVVFDSADGDTARVETPTNTSQVGGWAFVCGTYSANSADGLKIYVNGAQSDVAVSTIGISAINGGTNPFLVGMRSDTTSMPYDGLIDEVRVYNRAITASEVASLYTQGGGTKVNTAVSQPQGTGRLDSGLAGYWKMDDGSGTSATDSSTNGITGTLTNGPTWTTGQIGGAVDFDGTDDYITAGDQASLEINSSSLSIGGWFKIDAYPSGNRMFLITKGGTSGDYEYELNVNGSISNKLKFSVFNTSTSEYIGVASVTVPTIGTWFHVLAVWDKDATATRMYYNGVLEGTSSSTSGPIHTTRTSHFNIGRRADSAETELNGMADEVRVYSRALSADEVAQLYRLTAPTGVDTSLKGYWSFNAPDMASTTAYDRSGAGNTGTLTNGPTKATGKIGQALNFDGSDDYVLVPDVNSLDITGAITMSVWLKTSDTSTCIMAKSNAGPNTDTCFGTSADKVYEIGIISGTLYFQISNGATASSVSGSATSITDNQWHLVTAVWDGTTGTNGMKIYFDGNLTYQATSATASIQSTANDLLFSNKNSVYDYTGLMDEARLYNRALSAGEIKGLYDVGQSDKTNTSVSQPQGTGRLDSGLAGYWKLDENTGTSAADSSTNANAGTLTSGPTWTTGQIGSAVNFDGTDDYVALTDSSVFDPGGTASWCHWLKPATGQTGKGMFEHEASGTYQWMTYISSASSVLLMYVRVAGNVYTASSPSGSYSNSWHHLCGTFDKNLASERLKIYVNGVLVGSNNAASGDIGAGNTPILGAWSGGGGFFEGQLDEVRIYNRALSADEVAELYRLTAPTGTDTGLKGYWSFNGKDISGTTAFDQSGAGNNGTLTNSPTKTIGKIGQGLSFDGTNDYVDSGGASSLEPSLPFSISAWVKFDTLTGNTIPIVSSADIGGNGQYAGIWLGTDSTGLLVVALGNNAGCCDSAFRRSFVTGSGVVTTGTWYHIVATVTDVNTSTIYVNGASQSVTASGAAVSSVYPTNSRFRIGAVYDANTTTDKFLDGTADEVRLYNRALSASEITALYNSSR